MHSDEDISRLAAAVRELDLKPRERRWARVSVCVLDAVYSIGAHYDNHVVPVVRRVAADFDVESPSVEMSVPEAADPVPLDAFLDRYTSVEALVETTKNRRTPRHVAAYVRLTRFFGTRRCCVNTACSPSTMPAGY
ncbi:MAG: hypothetical protein ACRDTW_14385 [Rhodococcus qingshengii]